MFSNLSTKRADYKGYPKSNSTGYQSMISARSPLMRSPKAKPIPQPPTVGCKVHLGGDQVQSASALKIMSPAAMRLFELPADSQEVLFTDKDKVAVDASLAVIAKSMPLSHQDISEIKPNILSEEEGWSSEGFKNCPMVTAILKESPRTRARNDPKCTLCHKSFDCKRLLKAH
jgi:hypothetical protein